MIEPKPLNLEYLTIIVTSYPPCAETGNQATIEIDHHFKPSAEAPTEVISGERQVGTILGVLTELPSILAVEGFRLVGQLNFGKQVSLTFVREGQSAITLVNQFGVRY